MHGPAARLNLPSCIYPALPSVLSPGQRRPARASLDIDHLLPSRLNALPSPNGRSSTTVIGRGSLHHIMPRASRPAEKVEGLDIDKGSNPPAAGYPEGVHLLIPRVRGALTSPLPWSRTQCVL